MLFSNLYPILYYTTLYCTPSTVDDYVGALSVDHCGAAGPALSGDLPYARHREPHMHALHSLRRQVHYTGAYILYHTTVYYTLYTI